jgi:hypothetical protein
MNRKPALFSIILAIAVVFGTAIVSSAHSTPVAAKGCTVEPRTFAELSALANAPLTPTPPPVSMTIGEPISSEVANEIQTTVQRFIDCSNSGEPLRVFALYTDRYLQQLLTLERPLIDQARYDSLATPIPASAGDEATLIHITKARRLLDGRAGAEVTISYPSIPTTKTFFFTFVITSDGLLIDDILGELTFALP